MRDANHQKHSDLKEPRPTSAGDDRFWDALRDAGAKLGPIESSLPPPKTTFEELLQRAKDLESRVARRKRGWWRFGF